MSLRVALKNTTEQLGKAIADMRALGVKITESTDAAKVPELEAEYDKHRANMTTLMARQEKLSADIEMESKYEKLSKVVVNPTEGTLPEHHAAGGAPARETTDGLQVGKQLHKAAFMAYVRHGDKSSAYTEAMSEMRAHADKLGPAERHALLGTNNQLGGYLTTDDFRAEVVKNLAGITVVRMAGARVVPVSGPNLVYPSIAAGTDPYSTGYAGAWRAEGAQGTDGSAPARQDQPTFGQERIPVHVWQPAAVVLTREIMDDAVVPLEGILAQVVAETKGQDEDYAFIRGDGIGRPRGIFDYIAAAAGPSITAVNSGAAATFTYNGLLDLFYTLPIQYRDSAAFMCRSLAFAEILKLKDSSQMPILYSNQIPGTLFGKKVWMSEHCPAVAANAYPLVFGQFGYYTIAERTDLRMQRLEERFAPNVGFLPTARLGGGLIRTQPFVAQKMST